MRLTTALAQESFSEQIDFVAENGAWRVAEDKSIELNGGPVFSFSEDTSGGPGEDRAYGFFAPLDALSAPQETSAEDEGFGFFAPLPAANLAEENNAYGFFAPLTPPAAVGAEPAGNVEGEALATESAEKPAPVISSAGRQAKTAGPAESSIRVGVEKVDQLINLVGELVITQAMLLQTAMQMQESAPERLINGLVQLERNTRDLQESVMSIRMMPISSVFSRFPRVVRDLSGKLGKQVELKTSGETTELDRGLIERIADPLTHLIRNSLDHGIELPEKRVQAGKSPAGTITLKAYHQGGNIVIEVGDDGAGLPRDKILAKARERGLAVAEQMTDAEVFNLIFEAGFSTADQVTDVSGRGVGMDVVRRNIQSMGGRVEIESMLGIGTRMTVRLPLTLAILDGMSVAVGDQTYILPLAHILESLQPQAGEIKTLANQAQVIQVRGEYLPVVVLHEIFNLKSAANDFAQGILVVIEADGAKIALFVDALVGQHQVVIKSLEANYRRVPGVSGATIMGDGQVALILDVSALAGMARSNMQRAD
ncbi:chemotaxis protein CheW [Dechloromonas sp. A34]|uniref:chemotaxis protein CheW n=1 Tax=Dechloromonas sp. A34 TaxID=447588 RepID=UPI0022498B77